MLPADLNVTVEQLRDLIGLRVWHRGQQWQVIEVLEDGPSLVLQDCAPHTVIQPDQHGEAHRRVPHTLNVPLVTGDRQALNPVFLDLELIDQQ